MLIAKLSKGMLRTLLTMRQDQLKKTTYQTKKYDRLTNQILLIEEELILRKDEPNGTKN